MAQLLLRRGAQAVVDHAVEVAGGAAVQLFLRHLAVPVVAADFQLIHTVRSLGEQRLELMGQYPEARLPDIFVHGRRDGADHPAVAVAVAHLGADSLCLRAAPQLVPALGVQVAHNFLILGAVAGHDVAVGVDEEGIEAHITGQQTLLAVEVVDEAVVEVGAEPLFGRIAPQQLVDEGLEVLRHHGAVVDDVLGLHEVEAVVQGGGGEFHPHLIRQAVEGDEVGGVLVLHGHAEAHILHAHLPEFFQGGVAAVVAVGEAAYLVVGLLEALDGDADADVGELFAQVEDTVGEEAVGGDDDAVRLLPQLPHDVLQIRADKGLAAGDVGKIHGRQLADGLEADLFLGLRGCLIAVAHGAARVAAVGDDNGSVQFLGCHESFSSVFTPDTGASVFPHILPQCQSGSSRRIWYKRPAGCGRPRGRVSSLSARPRSRSRTARRSRPCR